MIECKICKSSVLTSNVVFNCSYCGFSYIWSSETDDYHLVIDDPEDIRTIACFYGYYEEQYGKDR